MTRVQKMRGSQVTNNLILSDEFLAKAEDLKNNIRQKITDIGAKDTPAVDGQGKKIIRRRDDGYDYIIEGFMRSELDRLFPGWSWEPQTAPMFLGAEWVYWWGILSIIDENLVGLGVIPPLRKFGAGSAARIKYKSGLPHTTETIIDVGNDIAGANSKALKKAINSLTHIGDDIYKKRLDYEGMGSFEDVLASTNSAMAFTEIIEKQRRMKWSEVFSILGVTSLKEITDFSVALDKIKEVKGF